MARHVSGCSRVVVLNTVGTFNIPGRCDEKQTALPGFVQLHDTGQLREYLRRRLDVGRVRVLYTPLTAHDEHFEPFLQSCLAAKNIVVCIDEVWHFQTPNWSPRVLKDAMLAGRHSGTSLCWTAQCPQLTDSKMRSVSTEYFIGSLPSALDQAAFKNTVAPAALRVASRLPARSFVHRFPDYSWEIERG